MIITVSVSELYELAKAMLNDGMDTVEVSMMEADDEDQLPPCLHFVASKKCTPYEGVDYECLDDVSSTL